MKRIFFISFLFLSIICMAVEMVEISFNCSFIWSDHLHNFLDHVVLILINYVGLKISNGSYKA